ncbi:hypothetical protein N7499_003694 [Penicillium canescens]|uniref:Rhodopsin domain-containing protein n=1 Tax=Penicillium canescens TaxID=5083 RepID=A0AAD6IAZ9_PENCN|nr:uncharacterized protein N7446_012675 [Penicillium canescens]KAJ6018380.1 hypothetical protein N7522_001844 [Penicillium canescens]KAJ6019706.1 hypothetical protein N7522_001773 [Penicillium canescens]KAJ6038863.1 hypothetical protein N7460_007580 [Penicillium canescens]KAJ6045811.1 hypothetical protein N7446_012675 [Penicillium canescens]KAJ6066397.1 hypothetical protein N7444_000150 [Penicillium canescens]
MVDTHLQNSALGIVVAFPVLGGITVLLRLWSRHSSRSALTSDDYLITVGYILAVVQSVTSWYYIETNYIGIHYNDIPKDRDVKTGFIWNYVNQLVYNPALTVVKVSILIFLRRLESQSRVVNGLIWGAMAFVVGLFIATLMVDIFQCRPVAYVYDMSIPGGTCIDQGGFYVSTAALNLLTDLVVLSIPIIITRSLQMPLRRKIAVCVILCLGGVATAIGVWRIVILAQVFLTHKVNLDPTYNIGFCSSAIEVNVAVITACGPSMNAIASRYLPRLLGTSRRETSGYAAGTSGSRGRFHGSKRFMSKNLHSSEDDRYELVDPNARNTVSISRTGSGRFDMRKYRRGGDSPNISRGVTPDNRSRDGKHATVDSLV